MLVNNLSNFNINKDNFIKNQYTISLLKESLERKIVEEREVYGIQQEISLILRDLIKKYTNGQSTSVKIEVAENLLISIWYAIDSYMSKLDSLEESILELKSENIKEIYTRGLEVLEKDTIELEAFYKLMNSRKLDTNSIAYNDTLNELSGFFNKYSIKFKAHDIPISIDYPLALDDMDIQGINYVKNYIETLDIENRFCNLFDKKNREKLFLDYGITYKIDCDVILINLFELIINNAIFSTILGNEPANLEIEQYEYEFLERRLKEIYNYKFEDSMEVYEENNRISYLLADAIERLIKKLNIEDKTMINYIEKYEKGFIDSVITTIKNNTFKSIITVSSNSIEYIEAYFIDDENKLDDKKFREIFNRILESTSVIEKINIIKKNINSKKDFMDILESECLFDEEYYLLFESLNELELGILGSVVFYEELRMKEINLMESLLKVTNESTTWKLEYIKFIKRQNRDRIHYIEEYINQFS